MYKHYNNAEILLSLYYYLSFNLDMRLELPNILDVIESLPFVSGWLSGPQTSDIGPTYVFPSFEKNSDVKISPKKKRKPTYWSIQYWNILRDIVDIVNLY